MLVSMCGVMFLRMLDWQANIWRIVRVLHCHTGQMVQGSHGGKRCCDHNTGNLPGWQVGHQVLRQTLFLHSVAHAFPCPPVLPLPGPVLVAPALVHPLLASLPQQLLDAFGAPAWCNHDTHG